MLDPPFDKKIPAFRMLFGMWNPWTPHARRHRWFRTNDGMKSPMRQGVFGLPERRSGQGI
ncbi:hypothetical protein [Tritonibacter mobilis]|uniref:hypothetical protein n=1 Tax=Tritonibacter mobilis TaxID=379347 RepID=UPI000806BC9F|nr:hypothetical protein [Tritonibacter mobilis]